jgi:hypothetical protein
MPTPGDTLAIEFRRAKLREIEDALVASFYVFP